MVGELTDARRSEPAFGLDERAMLEAWLEWHRTTLLLKCEGLTDEQRRTRPVATSLLSLHGLVRHMAEVERGWFRRTIGQEDIGTIFSYDVDDDAELALADADWDTDLATWQSECEAARRVASAHDLDYAAPHHRHGELVSLRWVFTHMIEEYARHNGHADLIRELVDGTVGW
ncbi:MAG TPA: DinB family protein [Mycobacteriales bacterium]|nr:DinB family protein [Mycobacteriales bacterium]